MTRVSGARGWDAAAAVSVARQSPGTESVSNNLNRVILTRQINIKTVSFQQYISSLTVDLVSSPAAYFLFHMRSCV